MAEAKSDLFRALAHPLRVRILEAVASAGRASIPDLTAASGVKASHLSQHLALLRRQRLLTAARAGGQLFYRLTYPETLQLLEATQNLLRADIKSSSQELARSLATALQESVATRAHQVEGAYTEEHLAELAPDLDVVLDSRSVVDKAVRVLMRRHSSSAETAQEALLMAARLRDTSIRKLAAEVVAGGDLFPAGGPGEA